MGRTAKPPVPIPIKPRKNRLANQNTRRSKRREWEPTSRQWAIYDAVARGGSLRHVGAEFKMTFQAVGQICDKIDGHLTQVFIDRVRRIRERHTSHLTHIFTEAMDGWEQSKKVNVNPVVTEAKDGEKKDVPAPQAAIQLGNPAFLREARAALADIRNIHSVNKNPKLDDVGGSDTGERVAGKNREQVMQERINALNASLTASRALSSEQAG